METMVETFVKLKKLHLNLYKILYKFFFVMYIAKQFCQHFFFVFSLFNFGFNIVYK